MLVAGKFLIEFVDGSIHVLEEAGDYSIFEPRTYHHWRALEDSTMLSVRWPSRPNEQRDGETENWVNVDRIEDAQWNEGLIASCNGKTEALTILEEEGRPRRASREISGRDASC